MKTAAIAFALFGIHIGPHRVLPVGYAPAWSPNAARIAYVTRGDLWVADRDGTRQALLAKAPTSPPGRRTGDGSRSSAAAGSGRSAPTGWTSAVSPAGRTRTGRRPGRWLLGFTSLLDNLGPGSSVIVGVRAPGQSRMDARQLVRLANGRTRVYDDVAALRYTNSPPHHHSHLRYDNDAASMRIRLTWHRGAPSVRVLRSCQGTPTC